ncbi:MAG: methyltransferase domain-containing protein, partial [Candidatus Dormibacteraeota bacterium]|nr:methyltransferase domain-containing protein [Candidatus Dormibacteraeota bacterium]
STTMRGAAVAIDLSAQMLERARHRVSRLGLRHRALLVRADATRLPLPAASFDAAACFFSLHCIPDQPAVLGELARVLRPGARLGGATICADPPLPWRLLVAGAAGAYADFFVPPKQEQLARWGAEAGFDWHQERAGAILYFTAIRLGGMR